MGQRSRYSSEDTEAAEAYLCEANTIWLERQRIARALRHKAEIYVNVGALEAAEVTRDIAAIVESGEYRVCET